MYNPTMFFSRIKSVVLVKCNDKPSATGIIVGFEAGSKNSQGEVLYDGFLCTCKHVFDFSKQGVVYSLCFDTKKGDSTKTL